MNQFVYRGFRLHGSVERNYRKKRLSLAKVDLLFRKECFYNKLIAESEL